MYPLQELLLQEAQELLLSTLPSYTGDSSALHPSNTFRKANEADVLRPVVIGEWTLICRAVLWIRIRIEFWLSWIRICGGNADPDPGAWNFINEKINLVSCLSKKAFEPS
jgi:hypothetical protein